MAERLTEKTIEMQEQHYKSYHNGKCLWGGLIDKLGKLEDIMEKYGIEDLETLEHIIKKGKVIFAIADNVSNIAHEELQKDRDTWKKACELACEKISVVKLITNEDMAESDDLPQYFYQQAKKEGEQK